MATFSGPMEVLMRALDQVAENMRQEADADSEEVARNELSDFDLAYML